MKLMKRIILAGIALILLLSMGAYIAIKLAFPPTKIKELIHKHGTEALNRDVTVEDVSIRIFPNLKLSVREVNVANAQGFSSDPCIKLRELALSIDFISLLKFAPVINEIKLVEPEILYEVSAKGRNNFEGLGKSDSTKQVKEVEKDSTKEIGSPAALALKSFVLENGRFRYKDLQTGRQLILDRINQAVSLDLDQRLENVNTKGKLEVLGIKVSDSASGIRTGSIRITVMHDIRLNLPAEKIQVRTLELGFQDIRLNIKGEASHFITKPPALDFTLAAHDIHLASVLKEIPSALSPDLPKLTVAGVAALDAHIHGTLDTGKIPEVSAQFTIKGGAVSHKELPAGVTDLNVDLNLNGDSLNLSQFAFALGGNPVKLEALLTSIQSPVPMLESLDFDALLDLGKIIPLAQKLALAEKQLVGSGTIQANIKAAGPLDPKAPQNLKAQGQIDLNNISLAGKPIPQPVKLNGQIKVDNDKIGETLALQIGTSDFSVSGSVLNYLAMVMPKAAAGQKTKAKLAIQSSFLNLDELMPAGEKKEEKEAPPMTAFPALPKLDAEIDIKLAKTQLMNLALTNYSSHSTLAAGVLTSAMKGTLYSGGFTSSMRVDLKDTSNADIAFKLDVLKVEANDFISRLNDRLPGSNRLIKSLSRADSTIFGKFNLNMDVKTHGLPHTMADNLTGKINFGILDGKLMETGLVKGLSDALGKINKSLDFKEFTFSNFKTEMEAAGGKLLIKDCQINESVVGAMAATGTLGFDNTLNLSLENHLPPGLSQAVTGAGSALVSQVAKLSNTPALAGASLVPVDKAGRAIIYFLVGGSLSKPSFGLDSKRMASEAGAGVKNALSDAFNKKKQEALTKLNAEKDKLESEAKARLELEKQKLQQQVDEQKQKGTEEAKKQGKKVLKGLGF
jgi:AsmA family